MANVQNVCRIIGLANVPWLYFLNVTIFGLAFSMPRIRYARGSSVPLVDLIMPTLKSAALLAVLSMAGICHAQNANSLVPTEAARVAAQTSSPKNYMLLQPIATKQKKTISLLSPMKQRPQQTQIPHTQMPQMHMPQPRVKLPQSDFPQAQLPQSRMSKLKLPSLQAPQAEVQQVRMPQTQLPQTQLPQTQSQPPQRYASADTSVTSVSNPKIAVIPMKFKRGIFDEHEFKIQNTSSQPLEEAKILLQAPVGSVVQQVSPKPDSVDGSTIVLSVDSLAPGEHMVAEVTINYPRDEFAKFESRVITESWRQGAYVRSSKADVTESSTDLSSSTLQYEPEQPETRQRNAYQLSRPKVPAMTASATTRQAIQSQNSIIEEQTRKPIYEDQARGSSILSSGKREQMVDEIYPEAPEVEELLEESVLKSYLHGPGQVAVGEVVDFSIDVQNLSAEEAKEIVVQLTVPANMKVTLLDRDAWYDAQNRKVSWKVDSIGERGIETIRYKALIKKPGNLDQKIAVGMSASMESTTSLRTIAR